MLTVIDPYHLSSTETEALDEPLYASEMLIMGDLNLDWVTHFSDKLKYVEI